MKDGDLGIEGGALPQPKSTESDIIATHSAGIRSLFESDCLSIDLDGVCVTRGFLENGAGSESASIDWKLFVLWEDSRGVIRWQFSQDCPIEERFIGAKSLIVPPGVSFEFEFTHSGPAAVIQLPARQLQSIERLPASVVIQSFKDLTAEDSLFFELLAELKRFYDQGFKATPARVVGIARLFAVWLIESASTRNRNDLCQPIGRAEQIVSMVQQHLETCLTDRFSIGELARIIGISPRHFRRLFRLATGMGPQKYVWTRRAAFGKSLLRDGNHNVAQAAAAAGFADQTHMNRHFRVIYGVPPSTFLPRRPIQPKL